MPAGICVVLLRRESDVLRLHYSRRSVRIHRTKELSWNMHLFKVYSYLETFNERFPSYSSCFPYLTVLDWLIQLMLFSWSFFCCVLHDLKSVCFKWHNLKTNGDMCQFTSLASLFSAVTLGNKGGGSSLLHCLCVWSTRQRQNEDMQWIWQWYPGQGGCPLHTTKLSGVFSWLRNWKCRSESSVVSCVPLVFFSKERHDCFNTNMLSLPLSCQEAPDYATRITVMDIA